MTWNKDHYSGNTTDAPSHSVTICATLRLGTRPGIGRACRQARSKETGSSRAMGPIASGMTMHSAEVARSCGAGFWVREERRVGA
jgi:hypothetical protein